MYNTKQNKEIHDFFLNNKKNAYSANDLVDNFKKKINRATIYRQINQLEKEKKIRKTFDEKNNMFVYQYAEDCNSHLHLQCLKCGKIIHLHCDEADEFTNHILKKHNFEIDRYKSTLYGICEECSNG